MNKKRFVNKTMKFISDDAKELGINLEILKQVITEHADKIEDEKWKENEIIDILEESLYKSTINNIIKKI